MHSTKSKEDIAMLRMSDAELEAQRYVAGSQFFNYETFGALREGGPISLISREYLGLAVSGFFTNVVFSILSSCVSPTLSNVLKMTPTEASAAQHLIEDLPACLSFFAGFVSDCLPIGGYHRKPYMLLGWVWAAAMLFATTALMWLYNTSIPSAVYIVLTMSVSFGTMVPYAQAEILIVELSQRESLQERGSLVARYQYVRILGNIVGKVITLVLIKNPSMQQIQYVLTLLSFTALIPSVVIALFLEERRMSRDLTWSQATQNLHKTAQQKVVWSIVVFVIIFTFFLNFAFPSSESAIKTWCQVTDIQSKVITVVVQYAFSALAILVWQSWGLNLGWQTVFSLCPVLKFVPSLVLALVASSDQLRTPGFFYAMTALVGLSSGLNRIYLPIALIEIVDLGNEGATVGLMLTFQKTLTMFVTTMAPKVSQGANWDVTSKMVKADTQTTRDTVAKSLYVSYVINLLSLPGLYFLPSQKLDAQQRRTYGGFTRLASPVLLVAFLAFFVYSLQQNISSTLG